MKKAKASIVTMIKAASSRTILLIFSSFLPARAVGVVGDSTLSITIVDYVAIPLVVVKTPATHSATPPFSLQKSVHSVGSSGLVIDM